MPGHDGWVNIVLIGPPGSGKGTQGERLSARLGLRHIAVGDVLRAEVQRGTELGRQVDDYLDRGALVPDDVIVDLVMPAVAEAARDGGYLLDGFPRTLAQAEAAATWRAPGADDEVAAPDAVVVLEADREHLVERTLARGRDDDTEDVVRHRLEVYETETAPVVGWFRERGLTHVVDANAPIEAVSDAILAELDVPRA